MRNTGGKETQACCEGVKSSEPRVSQLRKGPGDTWLAREKEDQLHTHVSDPSDTQRGGFYVRHIGTTGDW